MLVRRFLTWVETAPPEARASAVAALARGFLTSGMDPQERAEAERALTLMLDDEAVSVRLALAEALADAHDAPDHLVAALAADISEVAAPVLTRSPLLSEGELVERVATGDEAAQTAIARRESIGAPLAAAIAEVADPAALAALAANPGAKILGFSLARMAERHGADPAVRDALLARTDLPSASRDLLAGRGALVTSHAPSVADGGPDAHERATLELARLSCDEDVPALVSELRQSGQLTASLLLRAAVTGELLLLSAALADLAGQPERRAAGLLAEPGGAAFAALLSAAGLPDALLPYLRAALQARRDGDDAAATRRAAQAALALCGDADELRAMLRRLDSEAAREEARAQADALRGAWREEQAQLLAPPPASEQDDAPQAAQGEAPAEDRSRLYAALAEQILSGRGWASGLPAVATATLKEMPGEEAQPALDGEVLPALAAGDAVDDAMKLIADLSSRPAAMFGVQDGDKDTLAA